MGDLPGGMFFRQCLMPSTRWLPNFTPLQTPQFEIDTHVPCLERLSLWPDGGHSRLASLLLSGILSSFSSHLSLGRRLPNTLLVQAVLPLAVQVGMSRCLRRPQHHHSPLWLRRQNPPGGKRRPFFRLLLPHLLASPLLSSHRAPPPRLPVAH